MVRIKVVTGYIPIAKHPRTPEEYGKLGENFLGLCEDYIIVPHYQDIQECWLLKWLRARNIHPTHSVADNPAKNTLAYHCVQHQKFQMLADTYKSDLKLGARFDSYIWMDYGIWHVPGVNQIVVRNFLDSVQKDDLAIPGCWPEGDERIKMVGDKLPNWRFCGGLMIVPAEQVLPLYRSVMAVATTHVKLTNNVTWEVNTLAKVIDPKIRWYYADHNQEMFDHYASSLLPQ